MSDVDLLEHKAGPHPEEPGPRNCVRCGEFWPCQAHQEAMRAEHEAMMAGRREFARRAELNVGRGRNEERSEFVFSEAARKLLGALPEIEDIDDHQGVEHGTLTRCECGQIWPCPTVQTARRYAAMDLELLELVDVGWVVQNWAPEQLDPRVTRGIVMGYTDDAEAGRTYRIFLWSDGPKTPLIRARDVDTWHIGLPNAAANRDSYRDICRHVGKQTGSADGTEALMIAMALALAPSRYVKGGTVGDNAGRLAVLEHHAPAGARPEELEFGEMLRRAQVLAKTQLVPKALQNQPEAIVLVGALGAELGIPFVTSLSEIHVIEGRPSPSAQMRLALVRRAGHDVEFMETSAEQAVIRGRRRERSGAPDGWTVLSWTLDQARRAGLLDRWVERWTKNSENRNVKQTELVGDDGGIFSAADRARRGLAKELPEWAQKALDAGQVKLKENWAKYPADMLRARAASALCRMLFSDVLGGLNVDPHTPEELGRDVGQDIEAPFAEADPDDEAVDAELVEPDEAEPIAADGADRENAARVEQVVVDPAAAPRPGWVEQARAAGITKGALLRAARGLAQDRDQPQPETVEEIGDELGAEALAELLP